MGDSPYVGILGPNQSYVQVKQINLPQRIEGRYYLIFLADGYDDLYEHKGEENNTFSQEIMISNPAADLIIEHFTTPSSGISRLFR